MNPTVVLDHTEKRDPTARSEATRQTVAVSGASGLVGSAFVQAADAREYRIQRLVRSSITDASDIVWDTRRGLVNPDRLRGIDALVHLAGENIAEGRWTDAKKGRIRDSRVSGTRILSEQISSLEDGPRTLLCASAIGFYGDRGTEQLTETSARGDGFLAEVCEEWETATAPARESGIRVVNLRIGVVLSREGGALPKMLLPFQLGLGGPLGRGRQYWSWIHLSDVVGAILHCLEHEQFSGPVNCVSPEPVTNREFTRVLGHVLRRPTVLPVPPFAARLLLGEMSDALLMASHRVLPARLTDSGYQFEHDSLESALRAELDGRFCRRSGK